MMDLSPTWVSILIALSAGGIVALGLIAFIAIREWFDRKVRDRMLGDDHEMIEGSPL